MAEAVASYVPKVRNVDAGQWVEEQIMSIYNTKCNGRVAVVDSTYQRERDVTMWVGLTKGKASGFAHR